MFYKGSGGLKSMFFEAISAAQKSEEKHQILAIFGKLHVFADYIYFYEANSKKSGNARQIFHFQKIAGTLK